MADDNKTIMFGVADPSDAEDIFRLRYKVYAKYNYLNLKLFPKKKESDGNDFDGSSVYFIAKVEDRILGFVRLIQGKNLPIKNNYTFTPPEDISSSDRKHTVELGRLIIDKYSEDQYFPRNIILLFLISVLVEYCKENSIYFAYSFLKQRLIKKLNLLKIPHVIFNKYILKYPKTGPMAPYFFDESDPALPGYFKLQDMQKYVDKTLKNKLLFKKSGDTFFLKRNLYTKFLKTAGVI